MNFHEYYSEAVVGNSTYHQFNQKLLENMVTKKEEVHKMTQEQRDQQWEIVGLYCVFIFRKQKRTGSQPYYRRNPFDNVVLRRDIIDVKNWE